jgi:hypothetical protein
MELVSPERQIFKTCGKKAVIANTEATVPIWFASELMAA